MALAGGLVKEDGGGSSGVERLDATGHGNTDAGVGAVLDFFREARAFVAHEQRYRFAPIHFPRGEDAGLAFLRFAHTGRKSVNFGDSELCEKNRERHPGKNREVERRASRGPQGFRRKGAGRAGLARGSGDRAGGTESCGGAKDGADVAGILYAGQNDQQWRACGRGRSKEVIERSNARMDQGGDSLRMLGIGESFEEPVGGAQGGKTHFGPADQGSEALVVAFAGFAEEHGFDATARAKCFFDKANAFDTNRAGFRGQTAAEGHAKFLEPAVVATGEDSRRGWSRRVAGGFAGGGHGRQGNKFTRRGVMPGMTGEEGA